MNLYQVASAFGTSVALPLLYKAIGPAVTSSALVTSAKVAGSLAAMGVGYLAARSIYRSECNRLHDYLWLERDWGFDEAMITIERGREALIITTLAAFCLPMLYFTFPSK